MTQQLTKITFKVVGCTSWEDGYHPKSLEHIHPFVEGWRSERYCLYPQQIVLYLPPPAKSKIQKIQILSHEFLIASKIELYIGTLPQTGLCTSYELNNVTYKRLGYVSLSENVTTSHKSREMKSVNVDVIGQYVKLVFYSNHINQFNLYSQVSIIGLNLLGHRNFQPSLISDQPNLMYYNYSNITGARPNSLCVSQTDDLLFQFSIDIETAEIIKKLTEKKNEAITAENFKLASILKDKILELTQVGQILCQLDKKIRLAIKQKNHKIAENLKSERDNMKLIIHSKSSVDSLMIGKVPSVHIKDTRDHNDSASIPKQSSQPFVESHIPVHNERQQISEKTGDDNPDNINVPETLSDAQINEAATAIQVFGIDSIKLIYSKHHKLRQQGLVAILSHLKDNVSTSKSLIVKSSCEVLRKGLSDKVIICFETALNLLQELLQTYSKNHNFNTSELSSVLEKVIPLLMNKLADINTRIQEVAFKAIINLAQMPLLGQYILSPLVHDGIKDHANELPFGTSPKTVTWRYAKGRLDILQGFLNEVELTESNITLDNIMEFVNVCLQHVNATVREAAMQLTVDLYRKYNGNIRDLLPVSTSDYIVMKNIFWRTLFQKLDELDEAQGDFMQIESRMDMQTTKLPQVNSKKTLNAGSIKDNKRKVTKADQDTFEPTSIDQTCPFCKRNAPDLKSKQQMDEHYLVDCPMLLQCKHCSQVVEIKNITSHYLHDCSNKANMAQCSNCCEVFISTQLESHVKASRCTAPPDDHLKCPLCHNNVNNTDDSWYSHLTSELSGCAKNPRRKRKKGKQN